MEQQEQKKLEREVQAVYSEKADEPQEKTKSDDKDLSDNDLEQISGGIKVNNTRGKKSTLRG